MQLLSAMRRDTEPGEPSTNRSNRGGRAGKRARRSASAARGSGQARTPAGRKDGGGTANERAAAAMARIAEETGHLGIEIVDIVGNVENVAENASRQVRTFTTLRTATDDIRASTSAVVDTADGVRRHASEAEGRMRSSYGEIADALDSLEGLVGWVTDLSAQLGSVVERLDTIGDVTSKIDRIAAQTHILALNTRIEASRAGQQGRGFAVIADSVRALAQESVTAAKHIDETVAALTTPLAQLRRQADEASGRADRVRYGAQSLSTLVTQVSESMGRMDGDAAAIVESATHNLGRADAFRAALDELMADVKSSSAQLDEARGRATHLLDRAEQVLGETAASGWETVDTPFINAAIDAAATIERLFEDALMSGRTSIGDLFDENYQAVPGTDPQQYLTRFTALTDALVPPVQEGMLDFDPRVVFSAAVDRNGYLPTHNKKFSQPQGPDPTWNAANCRNRRMFNDRTGLAAGRNTKQYLLQTYRRDMGGGSYALMKDVSAPIYVQGRHWGGLRIGYRV
jgi:methyl-accepting chemotaxis protein